MISEISKRDIIDILTLGRNNCEFYYHGRLSEISFLSRITNLEDLSSNDSRFNNMTEDIRQHTVNNNDWEVDWVFYDDRLKLLRDEELFINFIEQIFNPNVRDDKDNWEDYLNKINTILYYDNVQLNVDETLSGRPVYKITSIKTSKVITNYSEQIKVKFSSEYIDSQISVMLENVEKNPNIAIGKSKELLESCAKTILDELKVDYDNKMDFTPLLKRVMKELGLSSKTQEKDDSSGKIAAKLLGNLGAIPQSMAELRNIFGDGHGKSKTFVSLPARYARLAVGTSTTIVYFIWETYQEKKSDF
ncbi:MAG: abortive infection family protein [Carnobacterium sp.]|uniref:abortive infection family protein n=1 Tax=Carnobacterium sp. TaxID=48221 RepID=UPI003315A0BA